MTVQGMVLSFPVEGGNYSVAGEAASKIKKVLRQLGIDSSIIRKVSIASYEAEMNIVIHAYNGELILQVNEEAITVIAKDKGPGIPDIDLAMQEGYSTASDLAREMGFGAGMGFSNMKKCSKKMDVDTKIGKGTTVTLYFQNILDNKE